MRPFIWTNPHHPRMLCAKFGWNWPIVSGEEVENVKSLETDRWTDRQTTDIRRSERITWANSLGELKRTFRTVSIGPAAVSSWLTYYFLSPSLSLSISFSLYFFLSIKVHECPYQLCFSFVCATYATGCLIFRGKHFRAGITVLMSAFSWICSCMILSIK